MKSTRNFLLLAAILLLLLLITGIALRVHSDQGATRQAINPNYLDELNLQAWNWWPSPLSYLVGISYIPQVNVKILPSYAGGPQPVGQIAGKDGWPADVWLNGSTLTVQSPGQAGQYSGNVDLVSGSTKSRIKINLIVLDMPLYPLIALLLGLWVAGKLEKTVKITRPQRRLKVKLDELKEKALDTQHTFESDLPADWPGWGTIKIYDRQGLGSNRVEPPSLLKEQSKQIQDNFRSAAGDAERAKWSIDGEEVTRLEGALTTLENMDNLALGIHQAYQALLQKINKFDDLPVAAQAKAAVDKKNTIQSYAELDGTSDALQNAAKFIYAYHDFYYRLLYLQNLTNDQEAANRYQAMINALSDGTIDTPARLDHLIKEVDEMTLGLGYEPRGIFETLGQDVPDFTSILKELSDTPSIAEETPEETIHRLNDLEWRYNIVTSLIVIGTGFYTIYLANATFGSIYDYINIFLWGTGLGAGFQIARTLLPSSITT